MAAQTTHQYGSQRHKGELSGESISRNGDQQTNRPQQSVI